jgi:hypothetical protein
VTIGKRRGDDVATSDEGLMSVTTRDRCRVV